MSPKTTKRDSNYVSVNEAAAIAGVHRSTVWKWVRAGAIKVFRTPSDGVRLRRRDLIEARPPRA